MKILKWTVIKYGNEGTKPGFLVDMPLFGQDCYDAARDHAEMLKKDTGLNGMTNPNYFIAKPVILEVLGI